MIIKSATCSAFAVACLTTIATLPAANAQMAGTSGSGPGIAGGTHGTVIPGAYGYGSTTGTYAPQTQDYPPPPAAGTSGNEVSTNGPQGAPPPDRSAQQNVRESEHYTWLLEHNRAFREARERRECGPITDPQLHQQCLASFPEFSPWAGSLPAYGSSSATGGYGSTNGR